MYASGIQNTVKPNKLLSAMTVCRYGFYNGVRAYMLHVTLAVIYAKFEQVFI